VAKTVYYSNYKNNFENLVFNQLKPSFENSETLMGKYGEEEIV
jgi:hypothetical protein